MRRLSLLIALPFTLAFDVVIGVITIGYMFGLIILDDDTGTLPLSRRVVDGLLEP